MIDIIISISLAILYSTLLVFYIKYTDNFKIHNWLSVYFTIILISLIIMCIFDDFGIIKF